MLILILTAVIGISAYLYHCFYRPNPLIVSAGERGH